jgi:hypothetical protein
MKPESPLLYPQVPATCPYSESTPSSTHAPPPPNFPTIHLNISPPPKSLSPQWPLSLRLRLDSRIYGFSSTFLSVVPGQHLTPAKSFPTHSHCAVISFNIIPLTLKPQWLLYAPLASVIYKTRHVHVTLHWGAFAWTLLLWKGHVLHFFFYCCMLRYWE